MSDYNFCPKCSERLHVMREEDRDRRHCPKCRWTYYPSASPAVIAVIPRISPRDSRMELLMVRRRKEPHSGTWGFPAGFVEYGELLETALKREIQQETGFDVIATKYLCENISQDDCRNKKHNMHFYLVQAAGKLEIHDPEEVLEIAWIPLFNYKVEIGWQGHREMLEEIRNNYMKFFFAL